MEKAIEYIKSPEGQMAIEEYFNKLTEKDRIQMERANKLLRRYDVCDDSTFDYLMIDIFVKQERSDQRYYDDNTERPLNLMNLMWELASLHGVEIEPIDEFTETFASKVYDYYGYQFAITHGQGSILSVFRQNELRYRS
jgi:hypothetical protein